jgi:hypothetical protein
VVSTTSPGPVPPQTDPDPFLAPEPPAPEVVAAPAFAVAAPSPDPGLATWLREAGVTEASYARRVLYSWTSRTTADRLRRERELFDDAQMPEGPTPYVQRLEHEAAQQGARSTLAEMLLGHPDLRRRRYAWPRPWATRLGMVREYGDQLIAVVLRPEAIVGRFDPSAGDPWSFQDLDGRAVPLARVVADPSRLAAIHHVRRDDDPSFREYVLCNAAMIESWSLATPAIEATIAADAQYLRALADLAADTPPEDYDDIRAFSVAHYAATSDNLHTIADTLEASVQHGAPTVVAPRSRFDARAELGLVRVRTVPPRFVEVV